jgi:hypothetical protein
MRAAVLFPGASRLIDSKDIPARNLGRQLEDDFGS